jgi:Protein of unknown function (DUF433)
MAQAITRDGDTMHGVPVFRGTRVPVQTLFDYLEGGDALEDFCCWRIVDAAIAKNFGKLIRTMK